MRQLSEVQRWASSHKLHRVACTNTARGNPLVTTTTLS